MKKLLLCIPILAASVLVNAQILRTPVAATYTLLAVYSTQQADVFSFTNNQAALASTKIFSAGIYGERRFMLEELSLYSFAASLPTATGNFGLKTGYFGNIDYNETQIGLAYGRNLGTRVSIGAQFNYYSFKAAGYGGASTVNFEAGLIFHITEQLNAGVHAYNPTSSQIGKNLEEKLPASYSAGIGYDASDKFFFSGEIEKVEDENINVNAGMQYKFLEIAFARAGFSSGTSSYYLGLGFVLKPFRVDATASIHPQLGVTPGVMLIFNAKSRNDK
ncbi:MAG: hypothetical protein ICV66_02410 [Chitinophagaceae bacterium]|nr:hypothetical protein [Chitinophagaceae bacterium]